MSAINASLSGSLNRSSYNTYKLDQAATQMIYSLESGKKYQYSYQNPAAIVEGQEIKSNIGSDDVAINRNKRYMSELNPVMTAQTEIVSTLQDSKDLLESFKAESDNTARDTMLSTLSEYLTGITSLAQSVEFDDTAVLSAGAVSNVSMTVNASSNGSYTLTLNDLTTGANGLNIDAGAGALTNASNDAAVDAVITSIDTGIATAMKDNATAGVTYNNVLTQNNDIMSANITAKSLRYSDLLDANEDETLAMLSSLSTRKSAVEASVKFQASFFNSSSLLDVIA